MPLRQRRRPWFLLGGLFVVLAAACGDSVATGGSDEAGAGRVCIAGATEVCYSGATGTEGVGACRAGVRTCNADGLGYSACVGEVVPSPETCATPIDDDCDGRVNEDGEGCGCTPGAVAGCFTGPATARRVGACRDGQQTCNADGTGYGPCTGEVLPAAEICDGRLVDEDCDGQTNEEGAGCTCVPGSTSSCYDGPGATANVGACHAGTRTCALDGASYGACIGQRLPAPEVCDGTQTDEDCDGQTNEEGAGCTCVPGAVAACYEGPDGTVGVGACHAGTFTCLASGAGYGPCAGQVVPAAEVCDGSLSDENCNGQTNESGAGCVCVPGATRSCYSGPGGTENVGTCHGGTQTCNAQGTGYGACAGEVVPTTDRCDTPLDEDCNGSPLTCGLATQDCAEATGTCEDACSDAVLGKSNVGCVFYPTVTANLVDSSVFHFGVAVANTSDKSAQVTVTKGAATIVSATVPAQSAQVIQLPWDNTLKGPSSTLAVPMPASVRVNQGAYKLTASRGVTAYQFNALEYQIGGTFSYSNDASLLLPVNAWSTAYRVAARHHWAGSSGFTTVVAQRDGTQVTFAAGPQSGQIKSGITGLDASGVGSITLNAGDVVELVTNGSSSDLADPNDPTGMLVTATQPVQVLGGHQCINIPNTVGYCDHLEESMLPIDALGTEYLVTAPWVAANTPKAQLVRVVATTANTTLTYDPPQPLAPTTIAAAGGWVELPQSANAYKVTANAKILVTQYMLGQDAGGNAGDPAMATAVPTTLFRTSYRFHAPLTYSSNFVNVVAPTGAAVTLDGVAVPGASFTAIGGSGYGYARIALANTAGGFHVLVGAQPIGAAVYGYGQTTSYWYPAGMK